MPTRSRFGPFDVVVASLLSTICWIGKAVERAPSIQAVEREPARA